MSSIKLFENINQRKLDTCVLQMHEMPEKWINSLESAEARAQKIVLLGLIMRGRCKESSESNFICHQS